MQLLSVLQFGLGFVVFLLLTQALLILFYSHLLLQGVLVMAFRLQISTFGNVCLSFVVFNQSVLLETLMD